MKKNVFKVIVLMVSVVTLCAASRPSIEGRASIAEPGELPPGMYIKAHTFLPGDSVTVTNPSTKVSIEALVFGTIDEGVAAIVSEQVAEKLFITNNSDTLVQIQKIVASTDTIESSFQNYENQSTVEISIGEIIEDDSVEFIEVAEEIKADEVDSEFLVADTIDSESAEETEQVAEVEIIESEEIVLNEDILTEEDVSVAIVTEDLAEEIEEPVMATELETASDEVATLSEEVLSEELIADETLVLEESPEDEYPVAEDVLVTEESVLVEEPTEIVVVAEDAVEEEALVFTPFSDMTSLFSDTIVQEESEIIPVEESAQIILATEILEEAIEIADAEEAVELVEIEEQLTVIEEAIEDIIETELYEEEVIIVETPNILIPTEEKPAVVVVEEPATIEEVPVTIIEDAVSVIIEDEPVVTFNSDYIEEPAYEEEAIDIFALTPATEYIEEEVAISMNIGEYIQDALSVVGAKRYYIQLATYKNEKNISTILENYSEKYPIVLVESAAIKDAYQIHIGPLTKDEYTVVLERFKSYGYKDAFLKIAN